MQRKKGFTLIELLVVISIIALLLAILVPALRKAKDLAENMVCRSNQKQLAIATATYASSYDGRVFPYVIGPGWVGTVYLKHLDPFIDDADKVRVCPKTKVYEGQPSWLLGTAEHTWVWGDEWQGSYTFNGWLYFDPPSIIVDGTLVEYPVRTFIDSSFPQLCYPTLDAVPRASETPVFADGIHPDAWPKSWLGHHIDTIPAVYDLYLPQNIHSNTPVRDHMRRVVINRHKDVANVVFADTHAESVPLSELWAIRWHNGSHIIHDRKREDGSPIYQK